MGKCNVCGKKGIFLKINSFGRCKSCQLSFEKQEAEKKQQILYSQQIEQSKRHPLDTNYIKKDYVSSTSDKKALSFRVAGVTFKTGRKSRQVMLKNMYFNNTPPFDGNISITFQRYDYEGKLAIGVFANNLQIGNVPHDLVDIFNHYWTSDYSATFTVYGGGDKSWGCEVDVKFS